jgi:hypothetical protein
VLFHDLFASIDVQNDGGAVSGGAGCALEGEGAGPPESLEMVIGSATYRDLSGRADNC